MNFFSRIFEKIKEYLEVNLNLLKLNIMERVSNMLGYIIFVIIMLCLALGALLFLGFGTAEFFSELFESRTCGFFTTFGVFILLGWLLYLLRKKIVRRFSNSLIQIMTHEDDEEADEK